MSSQLRKKLEARVFDAAKTLGETLEDLRAYDEATRLVWHSVDSTDFASRLAETTLETLVGEEDAAMDLLSARYEDLRAALVESGIRSERR